MKKPQLHTIGLVARRSGLSPEVIRAWETRYQAVTPQRGTSGRRLYSDADIQRLVLLAQAKKSGRRISDIAQLSDAKLSDLVEKDGIAGPRIRSQQQRQSTIHIADYIDKCVIAIKEFDFYSFRQILQHTEKTLGTIFFIEDLLHPLVARVREEYRRGILLKAQLNLFLTITVAYLAMIHTRQKINRPNTIVYALEKDPEHCGLMSSAMVTACGWRTIFLDDTATLEDIIDTIRSIGVETIIFTTNGSDKNDDAPALIRQLRKREPKLKIILYAPHGHNYSDAIKETKPIYLQSLEALRIALKELALL